MEMDAKVAGATALLIWAVVEDLRTRKFANRSVLIATAIGFILQFITSSTDGISFGILGLATGLLIFLPLVLLKIVGAGDMKLMAAFGIFAGYSNTVSVAVFSLLWAAVFGIAQAVFQKRSQSLIQNMTSLALLKGRAQIEVHKIPFTLPLLLGWLTQIVIERSGGSVL